MPPSTDRQLERQLARLRTRYQQHATALTRVGFALKGSLVQRFLSCGTPGCHCHAEPPQLHGPYWQWSRRVRGTTVSRMLRDPQVPRYQEWIENGKRLDGIVTAMHDLAAQADALLHEQERVSPTRPPRRPQPKPSNNNRSSQIVFPGK